jgi:non-canonical purine NTP pyrophosphatase (RdgB/HAM1 family)
MGRIEEPPQENSPVPTKLTFATGNPHKKAEYEALLGYEIETVSLDLPELQPSEATLEGLRFVAGHKAIAAFEKLGRPAIPEDNGYFVSAFGGRPGPFIKQFGNDPEARRILCDIANMRDDHRVYVASIFAYYDGKKLQIREGIMHGTIPIAPRGPEQFAWDTIFEPDGQEALPIWDGVQRTYAELFAIDPKYKHALSMRRVGIEEIKKNPFVKSP